MANFLDEQCRGSLHTPLAETISGDGDELTGVCPFCSVRLTLGYARRLPVHEPATDQKTGPASLPR